MIPATRYEPAEARDKRTASQHSSLNYKGSGTHVFTNNYLPLRSQVFSSFFDCLKCRVVSVVTAGTARADGCFNAVVAENSGSWRNIGLVSATVVFYNLYILQMRTGVVSKLA